MLYRTMDTMDEHMTKFSFCKHHESASAGHDSESLRISYTRVILTGKKICPRCNRGRLPLPPKNGNLSDGR